MTLHCLVVISGTLRAQSTTEKEVAVLYGRGLAGDQQAVIDCIAVLEKRLAIHPGDQLARVYLGSSWTLRSRDMPFGFGKLSALRKGLSLMDEAAAAAPQDARVQLLRAVTNEALPALLGRKSVARRQLDSLLGTIEKDPSKLSTADRQLLYLNAGQAAQGDGDTSLARNLWERGIALQGDPKLTQELRAALATH